MGWLSYRKNSYFLGLTSSSICHYRSGQCRRGDITWPSLCARHTAFCRYFFQYLRGAWRLVQLGSVISLPFFLFFESGSRMEMQGGRRSPAVACWASDHWVASSNPLRGKFRH